jgi:hypothetical protein
VGRAAPTVCASGSGAPAGRPPGDRRGPHRCAAARTGPAPVASSGEPFLLARYAAVPVGLCRTSACAVGEGGGRCSHCLPKESPAEGRDLLAQHRERIDLRVLAQFQEVRGPSTSEGSDDSRRRCGRKLQREHRRDAEERIEGAARELRTALAADLLDRILDQTPAFFEQLVLDVLHAAVHGGQREDAARRSGRSGDEGVDGVLREDRLGLDPIYVPSEALGEAGRTPRDPEVLWRAPRTARDEGRVRHDVSIQRGGDRAHGHLHTSGHPHRRQGSSRNS